MKLYRPALSALAFFVAAPALGLADAEAAFIRRASIKAIGRDHTRWGSYRVSTTVSGDAPVATVRAELESDAGGEELDLVESDAWLHGAATLTALPKEKADLTVTLYDRASGPIATFSGTLDTDGTVTLAADTEKYDIELLAAEVFSATRGHDLSLDLAGADTYAVAYASIGVTEGGTVCLAYGEKGECLKWDTSKEVSTKSEVFWDEIGSVWEADATLAHEGLIESKVKLYDAEGEKLETATAKLGAPWLDDGEGVGSLATDEDPLTRVGLTPRYDRCGWSRYCRSAWTMTVVSEGWSLGEEIPVEAELSLTDGEAITIPVNSYQRTAPPMAAEGSDKFDRRQAAQVRLGVGRDEYVVGADEGGFFDIEAPLCAGSVCVTVIPTEKGYEIGVAGYDADASALPDEVELSLTITDSAGASLKLGVTKVSFDDEITAVFSNEVDFAWDPVGLGLTGKVKLLGESSPKGKQDTLAKGKFSGEFSRDADGDLELGGGDKDEVVSAGSVVVAGEALSIDDGKGGVDAPPVVVYGVAGNGSGTKNASTTTSTRPQLL